MGELLRGFERVLCGLHPRRNGEEERSSEVPRWQVEEARIIVQSETFLGGQEGAQRILGAQKEFSNNWSHLYGGRELPIL